MTDSSPTVDRYVLRTMAFALTDAMLEDQGAGDSSPGHWLYERFRERFGPEAANYAWTMATARFNAIRTGAMPDPRETPEDSTRRAMAYEPAQGG